MSEILATLLPGAGVGAEAAYKHQAAPKLVRATPYKALRNLINRLRSRWVIFLVVRVVVEVKIFAW